MQVGQIFFYTALKFSPNHPYATANFAVSKIKFAINWHRRPRRNKSIDNSARRQDERCDFTATFGAFFFNDE